MAQHYRWCRSLCITFYRSDCQYTNSPLSEPRTLLNNWAAQQGLTVTYHDEVSGPQNSPTWISRVYGALHSGFSPEKTDCRHYDTTSSWPTIWRRLRREQKQCPGERRLSGLGCDHGTVVTSSLNKVSWVLTQVRTRLVLFNCPDSYMNSSLTGDLLPSPPWLSLDLIDIQHLFIQIHWTGLLVSPYTALKSRCWFHVKIGAPAFILQIGKPDSHTCSCRTTGASADLKMAYILANNCLDLFAILGFDFSIEVSRA